MKYPTLKDSAVYAGIVLSVAVLVFLGMTAVGKYGDLKDEVKDLTATVEARDGEIGSLRDTLNETEEGKKAVEEAKKQSDASAAANARRANSAEADAAAKGAQLSSVNAQLATANTQLANVNRCVNKFNSIRPTILEYQNAQVQENDAWNDGNWALSNYWTDMANSLWRQISPVLNSIASGNCY
jgi:chromosome segregation ATPase